VSNEQCARQAHRRLFVDLIDQRGALEIACIAQHCNETSSQIGIDSVLVRSITDFVWHDAFAQKLQFLTNVHRQQTVALVVHQA